MIVQFFRYGNGLSKGPLDYLLGKDRDRDYAKVLQGDVSEVSGLNIWRPGRVSMI